MDILPSNKGATKGEGRGWKTSPFCYSQNGVAEATLQRYDYFCFGNPS